MSIPVGNHERVTGASCEMINGAVHCSRDVAPDGAMPQVMHNSVYFSSYTVAFVLR
jgi:hypothetical protein